MELKNKALQDAYDAVQTFYSTERELKAKRASLHAEFAGERLQSEMTKIDTSLTSAKSEMEATVRGAHESMTQDLAQRRNAAIEKGQKDALDPSKISPDFALLGLPVALTGAEMQELYSRNWNDPLFVRALTAYEKSHRDSTPVDFTDGYTRAIGVVHRVFSWVESNDNSSAGAAILRDNPYRLESLDADLTAALEACQ